MSKGRVFKRRGLKKRNRVFKRAARKARTTNVIRSVGPIAPRTICRMKYTEDIVASSTVMDYIFRLNSLYDPNYTGTGHQPYGRDTYAALYNRYRVFAVSYRITFSSTSSGISCIVLPTNSATSYTTASLASESPRAITKTVTTGHPTVISGKINLPRITGVLASTYKADDRYQSLSGDSPAESIALHILTSNMAYNAPPSADSTSYRVQLVFHCEWFDPIELSQS